MAQARQADAAPTVSIFRIAGFLSLGWLAAVVVFFIMLPPIRDPDAPFDSLRFLLLLVAVFMPVALIWIAASAAQSVRTLRAENRRLRTAIDGLQPKSTPPPPQPATSLAPDHGSTPAPEVEQPQTSKFATRREVSRVVTPQPRSLVNAAQQGLPLGPMPEEKDPPLARSDVIRALNFPDNENDTEGFAALRRALHDRGARKLVQASQDVLTLLSQDGIYMDDLHPDRIDASLWRRFARGERGTAVAPLGAIRDEASLAAITDRLRDDTIFRDTVHHFLRKYDQLLVTFEEHATDTDMIALAETRTARAFMLLGRAVGSFR